MFNWFKKLFCDVDEEFKKKYEGTHYYNEVMRTRIQHYPNMLYTFSQYLEDQEYLEKKRSLQQSILDKS